MTRTTRESNLDRLNYHIGAHSYQAPLLDPALYIVATPIGNLRDITIRALETLCAADMIACEDTRVSRKLLTHYGLSTKIIAYHEHNADRQGPVIEAALAEGKSVALISDAGTPLISDPGYRLVTRCLKAGHRVIPIPGPSALTAALCGAGLPTDTILFDGFLPSKSVARRKRLTDLSGVQATLVFYEAPSRIVASLADMRDCLGGDRLATLAREVTKRFETFHHGPLDELVAVMAETPPKGEIVLMIAPATAEVTGPEALDALLGDLLIDKSLKDAVMEAVAMTGLPKRQVYQRALSLSRKEGDV